MNVSVLQRLRAARLRPTIARIAILQVVEAVGPRAVSAEDVFQRTATRGTQTSLGTIYRVLQQLQERGLLLREWDAGRRMLYRLKPDGAQDQSLYLVCRRSGRHTRVIDPVLHERLQAAVGNLGLSLAGRQVCIEVGEVEGAGGHEWRDDPAAFAGRRKAFQLGDLATEPA